EARRKLESQNREGWKLVHYAIVAWVDEQCMALPWEGQKWWQNNSLELHYFQQTEGNREFYVHAEKALRNRERDAIEIYFLCVALGFRGFYMDLRSPNPEYVGYAKNFITRKHLPEDIRAWMRRTAEQIPLGNTTTSSSEIVHREAAGAPPLKAATSFVSSLLFAMIGLGCLAAYALFKNL
ncbi:MAG: DotU family type IV/VI secretion system protein, partial [Pirellulaceae bacterium]|nr:DotU family type IV/VI secretion system protein [Pirellulaceae bacterium]